MSLGPGTRVASYDITGRLGAGGMGEVYRARDSKLDRDVAIKILPAEFAKDAERVARFRREARTLASINHPHIAHLHGLEETADGALALVMELVEGEDLAERLERGPIAIDEALPIARQIADALEAAHEQGIVHRDLKPANIKLRDDGTVKVLDFGLAKAIERVEGDGVSHHLAESPTITSPAMTMRGVILGTAAYMAPEQAKGKPVDRRADLWAFGCVLYEMLTGSRAFDGEDTTEILGAIVKTDPDWRLLPATTPPVIVALLRRCLQKDPRKRQRHIGDAAIEIGEALEAPIVAPAPSRASNWLPWSIAALVAIVAVAWTAIGVRSRATIGTASPRMAELVLPAGVEITTQTARIIAISPDGQQIAMVGISRGVRQVYIRGAADAASRPLEGTTGAISCAFSPDGKSLAVVRNTGHITTVVLADGLITNITAAVDLLGGLEWLDDNRVVFARNGALWAVPATGGSPAALTTLDADEITHSDPTSVPGFRALLFNSISRINGSSVNAVNLQTGQRSRIIDDASLAGYSSGGHLLFQKGGTLVTAPFDAATLAITGPLVRLPPGVVELAGVVSLALSRDGTLVSGASELSRGRLVWVSRRGEERSLDIPPHNFLDVRISPDGGKVAYGTGSEGVWIYDLSRGTSERIIGGPNLLATYPQWVGEGLLAIVMANGINRIDPNGTREAMHLAGSAAGDIPSAVTPDGRYVGVQRVRGSSSDLYLVPLDGTVATALVETPAFDSGPSFSHDGRWFAYVSDESNRPQVYVRSMTDPRRKYAISTNGGAQPQWRRDGKELFYREGDKMMAVSMSLDGAATISTPIALFERRYMFGNSAGIPIYDVSADGQQFLMVKDEGGRAYVKMVLNFDKVLNEIAPPGR